MQLEASHLLQNVSSAFITSAKQKLNYKSSSKVSEECGSVIQSEKHFYWSVLSTVTQLDVLLPQNTVHGQCLTDYTVDSATAVSLSRDLSHCTGFQSREAPSSPLALLQRMVSDKGEARLQVPVCYSTDITALCQVYMQNSLLAAELQNFHSKIMSIKMNHSLL